MVLSPQLTTRLERLWSLDTYLEPVCAHLHLGVVSGSRTWGSAGAVVNAEYGYYVPVNRCTAEVMAAIASDPCSATSVSFDQFAVVQ